MYIAMNRFRIRSEFEGNFEKRWKNRQSRLDQSPGFLRFKLLKSPGIQGETEYVSHSEWLDKASFDAWRDSAAFHQAHATDNKEPMPREAYMGPPEFRGYEVQMDEVPGHRTDFRSVALDLKVEKFFAQETPLQEEVRLAHSTQGLPLINVGAFEGRILEILLRANGARFGVEVGTLGGYSASWLAKALPADGHMITIEKDPARAAKARSNLEKMGLASKVEIKIGAGREVLATLEHLKDLDFVFIDADKLNYGHYVRWALPRLRKGGLLLADNAYIWGGMHYFGQAAHQVPYPKETHLHSFDKGAFEGMSDCWEQLRTHPEFASIILPTGEGLGVAVKV
jgi:caffeoyl-CoA O-methyltransferase